MKVIFPLLFVALLSGCAFSGSDTPDTKMKPEYMKILTNAAPEITETPEFNNCIETPAKMCIAEVAGSLARKEKSLDFCNFLDTSEAENSCKYGVVIAGLTENNRMEACDVLVGNLKKECRIVSIGMSATESGNPTLCNQIQEEFLAEAQENGKIRVDQCKFPIIMGKVDRKIEDCSALSIENQKQTCISLTKTPPSIKGVSKK